MLSGSKDAESRKNVPFGVIILNFNICPHLPSDRLILAGKKAIPNENAFLAGCRKRQLNQALACALA